MFPGWSSCNSQSRQGEREVSSPSILRNLTGCPRLSSLPSPSSSAPHTQHGFVKKILFWGWIALLAKHLQCMWILLPWHVITQPHLFRSIRTKRPKTENLWYNFYLGSCTAALLLPSWHISGIPTFGDALRMDNLTSVQTSEEQHLNLSWNSTLGLWEYELNEVNPITRFRGQPSCPLIRLDQNFQSFIN